MQKTCKFNFYNTQRAKEGGKAHWVQANADERFWKFFVNEDKIQEKIYHMNSVYRSVQSAMTLMNYHVHTPL